MNLAASLSIHATLCQRSFYAIPHLQSYISDCAHWIIYLLKNTHHPSATLHSHTQDHPCTRDDTSTQTIDHSKNLESERLMQGHADRDLNS